MSVAYRKSLVKRWRKVKNKGGARLYLRSGRGRWDSGEVARIVDGVATTHYYTLSALDEDLREIWEKVQG